jgi:hypothetical protein
LNILPSSLQGARLCFTASSNLAPIVQNVLVGLFKTKSTCWKQNRLACNSSSFKTDLSYPDLTNNLIHLFNNQAVMLYRVMPGMISIGLLIEIKLLKKKARQSKLASVTQVKKWSFSSTLTRIAKEDKKNEDTKKRVRSRPSWPGKEVMYMSMRGWLLMDKDKNRGF